MPAPSSIDAFSAHFGAAPTSLITAPGRINLIGEHIDYLDGFVMPAAIDRALHIAVRANDENVIRIRSAGHDAEVHLDDLVPFSGDQFWLSYVSGVVEMLRREGIEPRGFDAAITSDLPTGAGLSSSAALETGIALAMETITGQSLDPLTRAKCCQQAEHEFAGVPCGLMDQLAVGLGKPQHVLMIDCQTEEISPVRLPEGIAIVVADTQVKHALADGEYRKRRESCEAILMELGRASWRDVSPLDLDSLSGESLRRATHVVSEMIRVPGMKLVLEGGNLNAIGRILRAGHDSLRDDFEVSCPELDQLVDAAYAFGAIGARMTGGGFGGSTVTLVEESQANALLEHLRHDFHATFGRDLNAFVTRASAGAHTQSLV